MRIYIKTMTDDDDKEVVAQACMSVADIFKDYGFVAVEPCKCCCSGFILLLKLGTFAHYCCIWILIWSYFRYVSAY